MKDLNKKATTVINFKQNKITLLPFNRNLKRSGGNNITTQQNRLLYNSFASTTESNSKYITSQKSFHGNSIHTDLDNSKILTSFYKQNPIKSQDMPKLAVYQKNVLHIKNEKNLLEKSFGNQSKNPKILREISKRLANNNSDLMKKKRDAALLIQKTWRNHFKKLTKTDAQISHNEQINHCIATGDKQESALTTTSLYQMILQRKKSSRNDKLHDFQQEYKIKNVIKIQKVFRKWLKKRNKSIKLIQLWMRKCLIILKERKRLKALYTIEGLVKGYRLRKIWNLKKLKGLRDQINELCSFIDKAKTDQNLTFLIKKQLFSLKTQYAAYLKFFSTDGRWAHNINHQKAVKSAITKRGNLTVDELRKSFGPLQEIIESEDSPTKISKSPKRSEKKNDPVQNMQKLKIKPKPAVNQLCNSKVAQNNNLSARYYSKGQALFPGPTASAKSKASQESKKNSISNPNHSNSVFQQSGSRTFKTFHVLDKKGSFASASSQTKPLFFDKTQKKQPQFFQCLNKNAPKIIQKKKPFSCQELFFDSSLMKKNPPTNFKKKVPPTQYSKILDNQIAMPRKKSIRIFTNDITGLLERQYAVMQKDPAWKHEREEKKIDNQSIIPLLKTMSLFCQLVTCSNHIQIQAKLKSDYNELTA